MEPRSPKALVEKRPYVIVVRPSVDAYQDIERIAISIVREQRYNLRPNCIKGACQYIHYDAGQASHQYQLIYNVHSMELPLQLPL